MTNDASTENLATPPTANGRLRPLPRGELGPEGAAVWDAIVGSRGGGLIGPGGGLVGPFNAWVHAPGVGGRASALGKELRFETSLERRLLELAIVTVGAHWRAEFEFWAHSRLAVEHGIEPAVLDRLARGEDPELSRQDEQVVHAVARELVSTGRLTDATYTAAVALLGETVMVELVTLCGYYTLVSLSLNAFEVPLPEGERPVWS